MLKTWWTGCNCARNDSNLLEQSHAYYMNSSCQPVCSDSFCSEVELILCNNGLHSYFQIEFQPIRTHFFFQCHPFCSQHFGLHNEIRSGGPIYPTQQIACEFEPFCRHVLQTYRISGEDNADVNWCHLKFSGGHTIVVEPSRSYGNFYEMVSSLCFHRMVN